MTTSWLGMLGALLVTVGVMVAAIHVVRRMQAGGIGPGCGVPLQVLKRVPLGPKQGVALLRVADRVLVVSIAEQGARLLTELDSKDSEAALVTKASRAAIPAGRPAGLAVRLPGLGRVTLFALLMAAASAMSPLTTLAQDAVASGPAGGASAATTAAPTVSSSYSPGSRGLSVPGPTVPRVEIQVGEGNQSLKLTGAIGLVVFIGVLTLIPALLLMMTSFTRILIVLHFLRTAIGTQTTPPPQILAGLALLLTGVVMQPVLDSANQIALQPFTRGEITQVQAYQRGIEPFREFMLANVRDKDLAMLTEMSGVAEDAEAIEEIPTVTVVSAFVISELRTAFQMGFVLFLPFVVVDVIVASVLMSLGMFMLPPMMISLPFKLLLFVLADGWTLVVQNLVQSFR